MPEEAERSQLDREELNRIMELWRRQPPEGVVITGPGHEIKQLGQKKREESNEDSTLP